MNEGLQTLTEREKHAAAAARRPRCEIDRARTGAFGAYDFKSAARTNSLPDVPAGEYEIIEFSTRFAKRDAAVETVVLSRDAGGWEVAGYFIR